MKKLIQLLNSIEFKILFSYILIFFLGFALGLFYNSSDILNSLHIYLNFIGTNYQENDFYNKRLPFYAIFWMNMKVASLMFILGNLTFGLFSALTMLVNGFLMGNFIQYLLTIHSYLTICKWYLHAPIEIIGFACFSLCNLFIFELMRNKNNPSIIIKKLILFYLLGVTFLLLGSIIESNIQL